MLRKPAIHLGTGLSKITLRVLLKIKKYLYEGRG